jgi:hypothetical protein
LFALITPRAHVQKGPQPWQHNTDAANSAQSSAETETDCHAIFLAALRHTSHITLISMVLALNPVTMSTYAKVASSTPYDM